MCHIYGLVAVSGIQVPLVRAMDWGCHSPQGTSSAMVSQVSLSGPSVLSCVLRAMYPGCHKRNVPDLSRMSARYHVRHTLQLNTRTS